MRNYWKKSLHPLQFAEFLILISLRLDYKKTDIPTRILNNEDSDEVLAQKRKKGYPNFYVVF